MTGAKGFLQRTGAKVRILEGIPIVKETLHPLLIPRYFYSIIIVRIFPTNCGQRNPMHKKSRKYNGLWTKEELTIFRTLRSPAAIQCFLESIPYSSESRYRSPRSVLYDRKAHCYDGALFAAASLRMIGYPPVIVDMQSVHDDDHVIAIFRSHGRVGAIAKSNFAGLRFREPVYRTIRELVMSYFESFYNMNREKSLRRYTDPLDLSSFDSDGWMVQNERLDRIVDRLNTMRTHPLMTDTMVRSLHPVDTRTFKSGLFGANHAGIYYPKKKR